MDLLPKDFGEFRSQQFWDKFFRARKGRAFEWYGEWEDLRPLLELPECLGTPVVHQGGGEGDYMAVHQGRGGGTGVVHQTRGEGNRVVQRVAQPVDGGGGGIEARGGVFDGPHGVDLGLKGLDLDAGQAGPSWKARGPVRVLIPGCGNSELSAHLYDRLQELYGTDGRSEPKGTTPQGEPNGARNQSSRGEAVVTGVEKSDFITTPGVMKSGSNAAPVVINVDFSPVVIAEMKRKHGKVRRGMEWHVMDMTETSFEKGSFDVVLDKGCLDALMGEEGGDADASGAKFLSEVLRLLDPSSGRYVCITLAQEHVLALLLRTFRLRGWSVAVYKVPLTISGPGKGKEKESSPCLQPFLVLATCHTRAPSAPLPPTNQPPQEREPGQNSHETGSSSQILGSNTTCCPVSVMFTEKGLEGLEPHQVEGLMSAIKRENDERAALASQATPVCSGRNGVHGDYGLTASSDYGLIASSGGMQQTIGQQKSTSGAFTESDLESLKDLQPGRRMVRQLGASSGGTKLELHRATGGAAGPGYRFSATILDAKSAHFPGSGSIPCAVFLVPQGREHEWLFASDEGQWEVVTSARAQRLILIALNRSHSFGTCKEVQDELSPLVVPLMQESCRSRQVAVPYMTTGDGIGWRRVVDQRESDLSGLIIVEDVRLEGDGEGAASASAPASSSSDGGSMFRRMVFSRNSGLIQSESKLMVPSSEITSDGKAHRGNGRGNSRGNQNTRGIVSKAGVSAGGGDDVAMEVDLDHLASEYHAGMIAGLSLISNHLLPKLQGSCSATPPSKAGVPSKQGSPSKTGSPSKIGLPLKIGSPAELVPTAELGAGEKSNLNALVIGLGGAAFPMFLRHHLPFSSILVAELDPLVVELARAHFGFKEDDVIQAHVADGVALTEQLCSMVTSHRHQNQTERNPPISSGSSAAGSGAPSSSPNNDSASGGGLLDPKKAPETADLLSSKKSPDTGDPSTGRMPVLESASKAESNAADPNTGAVLKKSLGEGLDLIVVDADSDDAGSGMSCPAPPFVEERFLNAAKGALLPAGMLQLNVVARSQSKFMEALQTIKKVFPVVYQLDVDGDVNRVLFCLPSDSQALRSNSSSELNAKEMKLAAVKLVAAASKFNPWGRGPSLVKIVPEIRLV